MTFLGGRISYRHGPGTELLWPKKVVLPVLGAWNTAGWMQTLLPEREGGWLGGRRGAAGGTSRFSNGLSASITLVLL